MPNPKAKVAKLPHDGERMIPEYDKSTGAYGDHIARYESAVPLVEGKIVLDIACGSGYGSKMLAKKAQKVYGVDIDEGAVEYAKKNYKAPNVEYKIGSGTNIPLKDKSVEVVATFETLEHIEDSEKFLTEIKRVLKPNGLLLLSTPNDLEFPEGNHFHVHEYEYEELVKFAKQYFKYVKPYYQATWIYTSVAPDKSVFEASDEKIRIINTAPLKPEQVLFFFLLCSDQPIDKKLTPIGVLTKHWSARDVQQKTELTQQHIVNLEGIVKSTQNHAKSLEEHVASKEEHIRNLEAVISRNPLRKVKRKVKEAGRKLRRA